MPRSWPTSWRTRCSTARSSASTGPCGCRPAEGRARHTPVCQRRRRSSSDGGTPSRVTRLPSASSACTRQARPPGASGRRSRMSDRVSRRVFRPSVSTIASSSRRVPLCSCLLAQTRKTP
ncbi:hypothetical protein [Ornithinimicrobium kibberense]|uniref:hypothetical protein n=1 Tax=Ornithinimicrobium kibberense TaxID=282060 RepID=UPI00360DE889